MSVPFDPDRPQPGDVEAAAPAAPAEQAVEPEPQHGREPRLAPDAVAVEADAPAAVSLVSTPSAALGDFGQDPEPQQSPPVAAPLAQAESLSIEQSLALVATHVPDPHELEREARAALQMLAARGEPGAAELLTELDRGDAACGVELTDPAATVANTPVSFVSAQEEGLQLFGDWPEPSPLPVALPSVMPFDPNWLPSELQPWIEDIAERAQCPIDFVAVGALVALSAVVGKQVAILPKREDDWIVIPNLWGAVVGKPGVMKTPALLETMGPLKALENEARQEHTEAMKAYAIKALVEQEQIKVSTKLIREAIADKKDPNALAAEALKGASKEPTRRRYIVNDTTVEKIGELLNQNPNGLLLFRDELVGQLKSLDKEGHEGARSFYLEAWTGTGSFVYDRIGRGTIDIDSAIVSILGGIQPGPLHGYVTSTSSHDGSDDGLLQRFQLLVWPDISPRWKNVDRAPDADARERAYGLFRRLARLSPSDVHASLFIKGERTFSCLRFSEAAQVAFDRWREPLEHRVRGDSEEEALQSHLSKYRSLVPSLALLIHLADGGVMAVTESALERALKITEYLESHARRVYSAVIARDILAAKAIIDRVKSGALADGFAARDIYRKGWAYLRDRETVEEGIRLLVELNWLREQEIKQEKGAPRTACLINPRAGIIPNPGTDKTDKSPLANSQTPSRGTDKTDKSRAENGQEPVRSTDKTDGSTSGSFVSDPDEGFGCESEVA